MSTVLGLLGGKVPPFGGPVTALACLIAQFCDVVAPVTDLVPLVTGAITNVGDVVPLIASLITFFTRMIAESSRGVPPIAGLIAPYTRPIAFRSDVVALVARLISPFAGVIPFVCVQAPVIVGPIRATHTTSCQTAFKPDEAFDIERFGYTYPFLRRLSRKPFSSASVPAAVAWFGLGHLGKL